MELLLLVLVIVALLLLVTLLSVLMYRQSRSHNSLLVSMLTRQEQTSQSLLNQLRTQDPYTLLSLQSATIPSLASNGVTEQYVPMDDNAEYARFAGGVGDELTQEDIEAFGFPVVYESEAER